MYFIIAGDILVVVVLECQQAPLKGIFRSSEERLFPNVCTMRQALGAASSCLFGAGTLVSFVSDASPKEKRSSSSEKYS